MKGVFPGIVARMSWFALVRVAEPWSIGNVFGAIFLVLIAGAVTWWAFRRR